MTEPMLFETHKKHYEELEYKLLSYSGLAIPDEIRSLNVPIFEDSWMHEITCGNSNKHIVLIHGYGGTSITFIRMFKELSKSYTVHALDLLGMGLSHRKQFNPQWNKQEVVNYFVDSIEEWRKQKNISRMTVVGHSYGGYIASCYACKYIPRIQRLCLISPAGTKHGNDQTNEEDYERIYSESSCFRKILLSLMRRIVSCQPTPSCAMNCCCLGPFFMDRALTGRLRLENQQKDDWTDYMKTLSKLTPNSELSFWKLFSMPSLSASQSTFSMFGERAVPFKIDFFYGDSDWMEKDTAQQMTKIQINKISYTIIPGSGHQILFDNPQQMTSYLL